MMNKTEQIIKCINESNLLQEEKISLINYLNSLEDDKMFLDALNQEGVDNWIGYEFAYKTYETYKKEEK